jgi:hypothetical protein
MLRNFDIVDPGTRAGAHLDRAATAISTTISAVYPSTWCLAEGVSKMEIDPDKYMYFTQPG